MNSVNWQSINIEPLLNWNVVPELFLPSFFTILILWGIRKFTLKIIWDRVTDPDLRYRWQKISLYTAVTIGVFGVGGIWFEWIKSISTFLGLATAGIAIALQDLIRSIAGWVFLIIRRPFSAGDRIQVGEHSGDVIDIRLFKFTLMEIGNWIDADQSTGRVIHLPNSLVINNIIVNYSSGFTYIWNEIPVLITFESNWKKAQKLLTDTAYRHAEKFTESAEEKLREASKKYMIRYTTLTPIVYTTVKDSGIQLTIRYLINPWTRRGSEDEIWNEILMIFKEHEDIDFAYPTVRYYQNPVEGKKGTRPEPDLKGR